MAESAVILGGFVPLFVRGNKNQPFAKRPASGGLATVVLCPTNNMPHQTPNSAMDAANAESAIAIAGR